MEGTWMTAAEQGLTLSKYESGDLYLPLKARYIICSKEALLPIGINK
jgi:hypothetical protein